MTHKKEAQSSGYRCAPFGPKSTSCEGGGIVGYECCRLKLLARFGFPSSPKLAMLARRIVSVVAGVSWRGLAGTSHSKGQGEDPPPLGL